MISELPNDKYRISVSMEEYERYMDERDRRLYLTTAIDSSDYDYDMSMATQMVDNIIAFNREDRGIPTAERKPIRIYINSPGGDVTDGFAIVSAIKSSKTPIYTINIGQWSSAAFLIGISGHKRFSLPYATFLMHDGSTLMFGSTNKAQDRMEFEKRFEAEVVKKHVLERSNMKPTEYDALIRVEYYMLPEDTLEHGFIDKIIKDIDDIL